MSSRRLRFKSLGRRLPTASVLVVSLIISILAVIHQGVTVTEVDVDDGGIWVTNASKRLVGHLNYDSRTLDAALRTETSDFDIGQTADVVTLTDRTTSSLAPIDVAQVAVAGATSLPEGSLVQQGGQKLAILDATEGNLWTASAKTPSSTTFSEEHALASDVEDGVIATAPDGTVFAASAVSGRLTTVTTEGSIERVSTTEISGFDRDAKLSITTVGDQVVIYDAASHSLRMPDGKIRSLASEGISTDVVLQEPGPKASEVALATPSTLVLVSLNGKGVRMIDANDTGAEGNPAPPTRHRGCTYAAWGKSGAYLRDCDDASASDAIQVDSLKSAIEPRFRTNRSRIVLNDIRGGSVWLPEEKMVLMDDWDQIESELDEDEKLEDSPEVTEEIADPERREQNTPPEAEDDEFGIRPGRTTTLPVLNNDNDSDGDVLTARPITEPSFGTIARTRGGRALQISDVPEDATGSTTFTYEASDSRAVDTATVTLTVHPWSVNGAPEQLRDARLKLGANAQIEYNIISDWIDPDGDPIYLAKATAPEGLDVQFREEGTILIRDLGAPPGLHSIALEVSDGRETGHGILTVDLQSPGNIPPIANADFVVARVGEVVTIEPLANDTDPNGDPLALVAVSVAPFGSTINPDLDLSTVSFSAQAPGSYQFTYTITDGPATAMGMIRVDVVDVEDAAIPVAEDDLIVLPAGGSSLAAPLNNDSDPSGGVLVVQKIVVPQDLGLEVTLVDRHLLRVSAPGGLDRTVSFEYWVSNGTNSASALVTVVPSAALDTELPPELQPDQVKVRVGDVASVNVLANDRSPAGLALKVDTYLEYTPDPEVGTPFVTGNLVRLEAGNKAGTMHVAYTVRDSAGNMATSTVTFQVVPLQETNAAPQPKALTAWAVSGEMARIPVPLNGIDPDGDSVTLVGIEQSPTKGTVLLGVDWLEYTPSKDSLGTDVFTYIVEDRLGKQATARVRVGIAAPGDYNQPPIAQPDVVLARPERRLSVAVLANDIDADGDPITLNPTVESNSPDIKPTVTGSTIALMTPSTPGSYLISYTISDGRGGTGQGALTINVSADATLSPPIARDDIVSLSDLPADGSPVTVSVLANDTDPDGDAADLTVSTNASDVRVDGKRLIIEPQQTRRLVVYTVTDIDGLSASAVVFVAGLDRNRPSIDESRVPLRVRGGEEVTLDITKYVLVRQGRTPRIVDPASVRGAAGIEEGISVADGKRISFRATPDWSGKSSISFEVRDGTADDESALSAMLTIPVEVQSTQNQPPRLLPTPINVAPGEDAIVVDLSLMVNDPDGADPKTFSYSLIRAVDGASVNLNGHQLSVKVGVDRPKGPLGAVVVAVDDGSGAVEAHIPVTVVSSTRPRIQTSDAVVEAARAGATETIDLSRYTINPFPEVPITVMDAAVQVGEGSVNPQGTTLAITPAATYRGEMLITYRLMDATADPDRIVQGRVRLLVKDRPDSPTITAVEATGAGSALVTFRPGSDNGAPITGYTLTALNDGRTIQCAVAACPVTGLTNGERHSFSVVAHNAMGTSDPSAPSAPVLVDMQPGEPTSVTATAGDGQLTVSWAAAASQGSAITKYVVYTHGGSGAVAPVEVGGGQTSAVVAGLTNGTPYRVTVEAHNKSEKPSVMSQPATGTPFGTPEGPEWGAVQQSPGTGSNSTVTVSWTYRSPNGPALDAVEVTVGGQTQNFTSQPLPTSASFEVPSGEVVASIRVRNGGGAWSAPVTQTFTAVGTPIPLNGTPTLTATGNHGELRVSGASPSAGNGYSADQLRVQYQVNGGGWNDLSGSTINVGTNQPVTVAFRQVSTAPVAGVTSAEKTATGTANGPMGPVSVSLEAGDGKVVAHWTADPGAAFASITNVQINVTGGTPQGSTTITDGSTSGQLTIAASAGTQVRVSVTATNEAHTATSATASKYPNGTIAFSTGPCTPEGAEPACEELFVHTEHWNNGETALYCTAYGVFDAPRPLVLQINVSNQQFTPALKVAAGQAPSVRLECTP